MSRPVIFLPPRDAGTEAPLPLLREPDVTGLAMWAALLMAGSVAFAFLSTAPAYAQPEAAAPSSAPVKKNAGLPAADEVPRPLAAQAGGESAALH